MNVGGRCYELAMEYVLSHEDCFLIHGQAYGRAHAWIETADGKTWDPTDRIHDEHAVEEKRYTRRQAGQRLVSGHAHRSAMGGTWHAVTRANGCA